MTYKVESSSPGCSAQGTARVRPLLIRNGESQLRVGKIAAGLVQLLSVAFVFLFAAEQLSPLRLGRDHGILLLPRPFGVEVVFFKLDIWVVELASLRSDVSRDVRVFRCAYAFGIEAVGLGRS